jgi:WD40 repeat protein
LSARAESLASVPVHDQKIVNRWSLPGDPHGLAVGRDGTVYVGVAQPQAVMAIDPRRGTVKRKVVLDSAEIASTKELVTLRTDRAGTHLFVANGSDESVTILALPELTILREITIEGEPIRDALPDPKGRYLYLLGRRVHVYDAGGRSELRTLKVDEPMAIAASANGSTLAVIGSQNGSTVVALYNAATFEELARDPLQTDRPIESALFAADDRVLIALSREGLFEKRLLSADALHTERICLPPGSGPQIATLASPDRLLFAERRCSSSTFAGSNRLVAAASLYGVNAYALVYDRGSNLLFATDRAGFLTVYRVPRAPVVH